MKGLPSKRVSSNFLVGVFVFFGTLCILGAIIWLGYSQLLKETIEYVTYFDTSVEGLEPGSAVKYQGVPIGTVSKIQVAPDTRLVEVVMQVNKHLAINDSIRAKLEFAGIAGGKFVQLHYLSDSVLLKTTPQINFEIPEKYIFIKSSPSGFQEFEISAKQLLENIQKFEFGEVSKSAVNFLNSISAFFNNKQLASTVANLDSTTRNLNELLVSANQSNIISNLSKTSDTLYKTALELKQVANSLNAEIQGLNLKSHIDRAFALYDTAILSATKVIDKISFRTENVLFEINEAVDEIRTTNKQLRKSLRAISESPSTIFLSYPPKPEK